MRRQRYAKRALEHLTTHVGSTFSTLPDAWIAANGIPGVSENCDLSNRDDPKPLHTVR